MKPNPQRAGGRPENRSVAYVMTHYPRVTQTFIAAEIEALRADGVTVYPMAMNSPMPADADHPEVASTLYIKAQPKGRIARAMAHASRVSPTGLARVSALAARTAGADLVATAKRSAHLIEAIIVWDACVTLGVDHIHAHFGGTPSTIAWLAVEFARDAGVGPQHWSFTVHSASEIGDVRRTHPVEKLASAETTICVSDHTRSQVIMNAPPELWSKAVVVRVGIDLAHHRLRGEHTMGSPPRLLVVGRLAAVKGHLVLIDAIALLRDRGVDVAVDLVGDGEHRNAIEAAVSAADLGDRVVLHGEVQPSAVGKYLTEADVFCLPSFDEGLPVSIMEAMAVGVPVIATYIAGVPELAVDGGTALVVPPANADALADAIERMVGDEALRAELTTRARRRVADDHDARRTLPAFIEAIGMSDGSSEDQTAPDDSAADRVGEHS